MVRAGVPGFNTSPRHIDYIRAAYQGGPSGVPYRLAAPATAKPAPGDLLCFLRDRSTTLSYSGLVQALGNDPVPGGGQCDEYRGNAAAAAGPHRADPAAAGTRTQQHRHRPQLHTGPRRRMQLQPPGLGSTAAADRHITPGDALAHCDADADRAGAATGHRARAASVQRAAAAAVTAALDPARVRRHLCRIDL
ncbi:hypothetical protein G6F62_013618 [Rhizopus arrhizus]|nr:hypothetical protein G6F62_013618 [Rhizopus arrhizus]